MATNLTQIDTLALAAALAWGFLVCLAFSSLLVLTIIGLVKKVYRQHKEIRDLKEQRKMMGDALSASEANVSSLYEVFNDLALDRAALTDTNCQLSSDLRSANRKLWATDRVLDEVRQVLARVEKLLSGSRAENSRLRRQIDALEAELVFRDLEENFEAMFDAVCRPAPPPAPKIEILELEEIKIDIDQEGIASFTVGCFGRVVTKIEDDDREGLYTHTITFPKPKQLFPFGVDTYLVIE